MQVTNPKINNNKHQYISLIYYPYVFKINAVYIKCKRQNQFGLLLINNTNPQ